MVEIQETHRVTTALFFNFERESRAFRLPRKRRVPLNSAFARIYSDRRSEILEASPEIIHRANRYSPLTAAPYRFNRFHRLLDAHLSQRSSPTVLEVGCGSGQFCQTLTERNYRVSGVDGSSSAIEQARNSVPRGKFAQGSEVESYRELFGHHFDAIVTFHAIEYWNCPQRLVLNVFESLAPGGLFIISAKFPGFMKNLNQALNATVVHDHSTEPAREIETFFPKTPQELLEATGLEIVEYHGPGCLPTTWRSQLFVARKPLSMAAGPQFLSEAS